MSYYEAPKTFQEQMAWQEVLSGKALDLEKPVSKNFRAKKEPFLTLEAEGWKKMHYSKHFADGTCVVIHFWLCPFHRRDYLKVIEV